MYHGAGLQSQRLSFQKLNGILLLYTFPKGSAIFEPTDVNTLAASTQCLMNVYYDPQGRTKVTICTAHNPLAWLQTQPSLSPKQVRLVGFSQRFPLTWKYNQCC